VAIKSLRESQETAQQSVPLAQLHTRLESLLAH